VAGAFGAAIIGSVMYTVYGEKVSDAASALPPELAEPAKNSVGAAVQVAAALPPEAGAQLSAAAGAAFTDAMGIAVLIGAAVALVGAPLVLRFMPAHHLPLTEDEPDPPAADLDDTAARGGRHEPVATGAPAGAETAFSPGRAGST